MINKLLRKGNFETTIIFLLSPFLSLPFILFQIKRKSGKIPLILISLIFGIISYLYVPTFSNDKTRYMERYELFKHFTYSELWDYFILVNRPDFIFDHLNYFFSKFNLNLQTLFFLITSFTVYSFLIFIKRINQYYNISFKYTLSSVFLIILSFSYQDLFSGIRFFFAGSLFVWVLYYFIWKKNIFKAIIIYVLVLLIHFSYAFFIPGILLFILFKKYKNIKWILGLSLIFLILPRSFIIDLFNTINLPESYMYKADSYLTSEREFSGDFIIFLHLRRLWLYVTYFYLFTVKRENINQLFIILMIFISLANITYSMPLVFHRFSILIQLLMACYLIYEKANGLLKYKTYIVFLGLFFLSRIIELYIIRYNISATFEWEQLISIIHIVFNQVTLKDVL